MKEQPKRRVKPKKTRKGTAGSRAFLLADVNHSPITKERYAEAQSISLDRKNEFFDTNFIASAEELLPYVIDRRSIETTNDFHNRDSDPYQIDWERFERDRGIQ